MATVNVASRLVWFYPRVRKSLDIYSELQRNPTLESELTAAVRRGVTVRLIAPCVRMAYQKPVLAPQIGRHSWAR